MRFFSSLQENLNLNTADHLLLKFFYDNVRDDKICCDKIQELKLETIVRLKYASLVFEELCKKDFLKNHWQELWSNYGFILTSSGKTFYPENRDHFELLMGAYFFYKSQLIQKQLNKDFSTLELVYLKEAIKYSSVHATQRYNNYLYSMIDSADAKEKEGLFKEIINNCQKFTPSYGSYGYMMLAEAAFKYYLYLNAIKPFGKKSASADLAHSSALQACSYAIAALEKSAHVIFNASLGDGLGKSNSYNIDNPILAKKHISEESLKMLYLGR